MPTTRLKHGSGTATSPVAAVDSKFFHKLSDKANSSSSSSCSMSVLRLIVVSSRNSYGLYYINCKASTEQAQLREPKWQTVTPTRSSTG